MRYDELARLFNGNASEVARHFKVTPGAVAHWKRIGAVPPRRVAEFRLQQIQSQQPGQGNAGSPAESS